MPRSTEGFISYDLRPSKQSERRILLDVLKLAGDCGLPIRDYRYVGMGANSFYDFLLMHKYLGLNNMVSLEHDPAMYQRALLNKPYDFIDVRNHTAANFIADDAFAEPCALWLDYDGGIGPHVVRDISSVALKLKVGDFCFVTVYGGPPKVLESMSDPERLAWLQDNLGDVAGDVQFGDVEKAEFPAAVHKILMSAFKNALTTRRDGIFAPLLQVEYSDSVPMVTVGGALLTDGQAHAMHTKLAKELPFLETKAALLYAIEDFHLTERERALFDMAATKQRRGSPERNTLRKLGFKDKEIATYKELIRYLPRYVETMV